MLRRTLLDGFPGHFHEHRGFLVTDPRNSARWYLYLFAREPVPGFDDQLINRPVLIVHDKIANMADGPIARLETVAVHSARTAQMGIGTLGGAATRRVLLTPERF